MECARELKDDISRVVLSGAALEWTWTFLKAVINEVTGEDKSTPDPEQCLSKVDKIIWGRRSVTCAPRQSLMAGFTTYRAN